MPHAFPAFDCAYLLTLPDGSLHLGSVFLSAVIVQPRRKTGAYTYAPAHRPPEDRAAAPTPCLHEVAPERLILGRFCQIASDVAFVTASANHRSDGFSTYPCAIFDGFGDGRASLPTAPCPDTVLGNDVWIGTGATILPGARIGDGAVVGAGAVVAGNVAPYTIVAGNPARPIRRRFAPDRVARLLEIARWHWEVERIEAAEAATCNADLSALEAAAGEAQRRDHKSCEGA